MSGFFGVISKHDIVLDTFFGTDYHSHLATKYGGMVVFDEIKGFQRAIHNIENIQFRAKFEKDLDSFIGNSAIGCIVEDNPQPSLVKSRQGTFAIITIGVINNQEELIKDYLNQSGVQFMAMSNGNVNSTELVAALINQEDDLISGLINAQEKIQGTMMAIILNSDGSIIVSRDKHGRLPVLIGKDDYGYCLSFESFAYQKLGYQNEYELKPGEIVHIKQDTYEVVASNHGQEKLCSFLFAYFGYPNSDYDDINVELMRYRNGSLMAKREIKNNTIPDVDYIAGMPDSGIPHAIGYANETKYKFARPFVKYTPTWPRSFLSSNQKTRNMIAKMKQIPVKELIEDKKILFVDDSIVRGTQVKESVNLLYDNGAKEVHMRAACPPIMHKCKFLNFSRAESDLDLLTRKIINELEKDEDKHLDEYRDPCSKRHQCMLKAICKQFGFTSLAFQNLDDFIEAIGLPKENICTYCFTGEEEDE